MRLPALSKFILLQRLKLRHKIAALGVVGMALCLLPLVQLLRWHNLELQSAQSAQIQLAPALLAVDLQRGLVEHRQTAARVLKGESQAEGPRREHQAAIDAKLAMLGHRLQASYFAETERELSEMRVGWIELVQRIVSGRSSVLHSNQAHRLLIEQTLQVIDNVSVGHADANPLRLAAAQAGSLMADGETATPVLEQANALLLAAKAQIELAQSADVALHQGHRALAASALLAVLALMAGLGCNVLVAVRRTGRPMNVSANLSSGSAGSAKNTQAPSQPEPHDGQQPSRIAKLNLLRRLRQPGAAMRPADQPTQPQDL